MSLVPDLTHPNPRVRKDALIYLSCEKSPTDEELLALAHLLRDEWEDIRERAAQILKYDGTSSWGIERTASVLPAELLLPALEDRSAEVRQLILSVLSDYPEEDNRVLSAATGLLQDPSPLVRIRAAEVLWVWSQDAVSLRPIVHEAIRSGEKFAVVYGCRLLLDFGPPAGDIVPLVWDYLQHPDSLIRRDVAYLLFKLCSDKHILFEAADLLAATLGNDPELDAYLRYPIDLLRRAVASP
jgi:HEAT repeat protein